jgi:hypothetical protein
MSVSRAMACAPFLALAACAAVPTPTPDGEATSARRRDSLPADADLALVRTDLIATASHRFGTDAVRTALAARAYLIAKRYSGMAPPPPPGAGPNWVPPTPTALLMRDARGWSVATAAGWRPADSVAAAEIDRVIADAAFWSEAPAKMACPDYGASLLLLKAPGRAETVRNGQCPNQAEAALLAALRA